MKHLKPITQVAALCMLAALSYSCGSNDITALSPIPCGAVNGFNTYIQMEAVSREPEAFDVFLLNNQDNSRLRVGQLQPSTQEPYTIGLATLPVNADTVRLLFTSENESANLTLLLNPEIDFSRYCGLSANLWEESLIAEHSFDSAALLDNYYEPASLYLVLEY